MKDYYTKQETDTILQHQKEAIIPKFDWENIGKEKPEIGEICPDIETGKIYIYLKPEGHNEGWYKYKSASHRICPKCYREYINFYPAENKCIDCGTKLEIVYNERQKIR